MIMRGLMLARQRLDLRVVDFVALRVESVGCDVIQPTGEVHR